MTSSVFTFFAGVGGHHRFGRKWWRYAQHPLHAARHDQLSSALLLGVLTWLTAVTPQPGLAQADTSSFDLGPVHIEGSRVRKAPIGGSIKAWNAEQLELFPAARLAEVLDKESGAFIKSYGLGSLATSAIRGGSASHTAIVWNGLPIQNPMLGQVDLSLLPAGFADEVQLFRGGNSTAWGSGAIGGVITLENQPSFREGFHLALQSMMGSGGGQHQQLTAKHGGERLAVSTRAFHTSARNDFRYRLRPDLPLLEQTHAAFEQMGVLQEVHWKPSEHHQFSAHLWWQNSQRDLPPTSVQTRSEASQVDASLRTSLSWKYIANRAVWRSRLGWFDERLDYRDPLIRLRALSRFQTAMADTEGEFQLGPRQTLHLGLNYVHAQAQTDGYARPQQQGQAAIFTSYLHEFANWQLQASLRQSWVDGQAVPLIPSLGLEGPLLPRLRWKLRLSRNFRLPTLNDLYWQPGGNPDLRAEHGWSQEAGLVFSLPTDAHEWEYALTGFNRTIHDWILWSIPEGQQFWSANNIAHVWSRGLEQRFSWRWEAHLQLMVDAQIGYDWVRSTNQRALQSPRLAAGSQLIYVPEHLAFGRLQLEAGSWHLRYHHRFVGAVSTQTQPLSSYQLGSVYLQRHWKHTRWDIRLFGQVDNLWNVTYRVIERRPMPGRQVQLGLKLRFQTSHRK